MIKENYNIDQDFTNLQSYYKVKSAKDYIDENVQKI